VLAAEHLAGFGALDLLLEVVERSREIGGDVLPRSGPFEEDTDVVSAALERFEKVAILLEPAAALHDLLRFGLIAPEIRSRGARLYFAELFVETGTLKDASAARANVCSNLRTGV